MGFLDTSGDRGGLTGELLGNQLLPGNLLGSGFSKPIQTHFKLFISSWLDKERAARESERLASSDTLRRAAEPPLRASLSPPSGGSPDEEALSASRRSSMTTHDRSSRYSFNLIQGFLENIVRDAVTYTEHARRKTVTAMDVVYALKRQGRTLYGFGG
jgi:hypothetical protein